MTDLVIAIKGRSNFAPYPLEIKWRLKMSIIPIRQRSEKSIFDEFFKRGLGIG